MILTREQIRWVLAGRKTEARRPTSYAELEVGRAYPVQRSIKEEAVCRVKIVGFSLELLGDITPEGAWREGFKRLDQFFAWFEAYYGDADRGREVYVPRFALDNSEQLRLLPKAVVKSGSAQYATSTTAALPGEPEAVDRHTQDRFTADAQHQDLASASVRAAERRERWSLGQRLARLEAASHVDHSGDLRVIRKRIEAMEARHAA